MCSSGGPTFSATEHFSSSKVPKRVGISAESSDPTTGKTYHGIWILSPFWTWKVSQDSYGVSEIRHQEIAGEHLQPKKFQSDW